MNRPSPTPSCDSSAAPELRLLCDEELPLIKLSIFLLAAEYGHVDDIPIGSLAACGVDPAAAALCEMLLTEIVLPNHTIAALFAWFRRIEEHTEAHVAWSRAISLASSRHATSQRLHRSAARRANK